MELITVWVLTWATGAGFTALAFFLTRKMDRVGRILIRSVVLALAFTPSIVLQHTSAALPAILIAVLSPFEPMYGWSYGLLFGALPIIIVWAVVASVWILAGRLGTAS